MPVAKGEVPKIAPPRPTGVQRNLVISLWDWGSRSTDVRITPRRLAQSATHREGKIYGVSQMNDALMELDPAETVQDRQNPTDAPAMVSGFNASPSPSPNFGADMWKRNGDPRSVGIDAKAACGSPSGARQRKQPSCVNGPSKRFWQELPDEASGSKSRITIEDPEVRARGHLLPVDHNEFSHDNFIYYGTTGSVGLGRHGHMGQDA